jgi:hypothetical protein
MTLLAEMIEPVEKPGHCAPVSTADCRDDDFLETAPPL